MARRKKLTELAEHDSAIWHTRDILDRIRNGTLRHRPSVNAAFATCLGKRERLLTHGQFVLSTFRSAGNGSYTHQSGFFLAGGAVGLLAGVAFMGVQAAGNSARRSAAAAAASQQWRPDNAGGLFVSTHGFYLQHPHGMFVWNWESVQLAELTGPGAIHIQGESQTGPVSWVLSSHWAELLLTLWALHRHPEHPQLANWIPMGWQRRHSEFTVEQMLIEASSQARGRRRLLEMK